MAEKTDEQQSERRLEQKLITFVTSSVTCFSVKAGACVNIVPNARYADSVPYFAAKFATELGTLFGREGNALQRRSHWQ